MRLAKLQITQKSVFLYDYHSHVEHAICTHSWLSCTNSQLSCTDSGILAELLQMSYFLYYV